MLRAPHERTLHVHGVDLVVAEAGEGGRPLLLVHGFTGAKEDFGDWWEALAAEGWWVLAPDLRGHGASAKPEGEEHYSIATFARDVLAVADAAGWDRFALLGHSMGGAIVQEVVLAAPERVERLVLMDTHHGAFDIASPDVVQTGVDVIRSQGLDALLDLLEALAAPPKGPEARVREARPGYVAWNREKLRAVAPGMYASLAMELVTRPDRLAELAALHVPTLVIVGDQDEPGLVAAAERMGAALPHATHVVVADAGHSPQFEAPDEWWAALRAFLAAG